MRLSFRRHFNTSSLKSMSRIFGIQSSMHDEHHSCIRERVR